MIVNFLFMYMFVLIRIQAMAWMGSYLASSIDMAQCKAGV